MGCLYLIESPSGKAYIGITIGRLKNRWRAHRAHATRSQDGALQKAIRKYGAKNMTCRELVISDDYGYLKELEVKAISAFSTKVPFGYNMTDGGDGVVGVVITEENRRNRRSGQRKSFADPDRRARHKASQQSEEIRQLRSRNALNSSKETRALISNASKARWSDPEYRSLCLSKVKRGPRIDDGLTKTERYRLKDVEAYRKLKREWAKTPDQKSKRVEYMRQWREKNREKYNEYCRNRKRLAKGMN